MYTTTRQVEDALQSPEVIESQSSSMSYIDDKFKDFEEKPNTPKDDHPFEEMAERSEEVCFCKPRKEKEEVAYKKEDSDDDVDYSPDEIPALKIYTGPEEPEEEKPANPLYESPNSQEEEDEFLVIPNIGEAEESGEYEGAEEPSNILFLPIEKSEEEQAESSLEKKIA